MAARPLSAEDFIAAAIEALRSEIAPALGPDATSRLNSVIDALRIASREIRLGDAEQPHWALLDAIYDDGEGSLDALARDIRTGTVNTGTRPTLATDLRRLLEAEIAIRSPHKVDP